MSKELDTAVSRESDKFMLRLPDGMRDLIAASAKKNNRSMNSEIVARLDSTFEQHALDAIQSYREVFNQQSLDFLIKSIADGIQQKLANPGAEQVTVIETKIKSQRPARTKPVAPIADAKPPRRARTKPEPKD